MLHRCGVLVSGARRDYGCVAVEASGAPESEAAALGGLGIEKDEMSSTGIIIQARMTSKRFPGKSMAMLLGKPVIQHVIERAKLIRDHSFVEGIPAHAPVVVLAVPDKPESASMIDLAGELDIEYFSGSEPDVLSRYYHAARSFEFKTIMRI